MSEEKQMIDDLIEIFDEEYNKRNLITPQFTADKLIAKGYCKQIEGEWIKVEQGVVACSLCKEAEDAVFARNKRFCPNCGAKMKGERRRDEDLQNLPTADVAEVVRCKDCKYYERPSLEDDDYYCMSVNTPRLFSPDKNYFCGYGERRSTDEGLQM